jgi:dTDP-4-dehydrorhamnose reductase
MADNKFSLIGAGGQLATDIASALKAGDVRRLSHREIELEDPVSIARALEGFQGVVINTAAYNLVDQAESEPDRAHAINGGGVRNLAQYCAAHNLKLVHFSTDYVLGGDPAHPTPLSESAEPQPVSVYAESKLAGENFVRDAGDNHLIIRTCGLYGLAATKAKGNFIETMLRLGKTRSELSVVDDQHCTPSYTVDVAQATVDVIKSGASGTFHVTNSGETTWCQLAREVFRLENLNVLVRAITTAEFGARARRPAYSVLNCAKLQSQIGRQLPPWQDAVERYLASRSLSLAKPE